MSSEHNMEQGQLKACPSFVPPQLTHPDLSPPQLTQDNDPTIDGYASNHLVTKNQTIDDIFGEGPTPAPSWSLSASEVRKPSGKGVTRYTGALIGLVSFLFITIPFFVLKYIVGLNI